MLAFDKDIGANGEVIYSIKSGKGKAKFRVDSSTGVVYGQKGFEAGQEYELSVSLHKYYCFFKFLYRIVFLNFFFSKKM